MTFEGKAKEAHDKAKAEHTKIRESDIDPRCLEQLKNPNLFKIMCDHAQKWITREQSVSEIIILVAHGGRLCLNASATSTNLCINSKSGAGKDAVCKANLLPWFKQDEVLFYRTKLTPQAFTYWKRKEVKQDGFTWNGKIVYLEDCSNGLLNSDCFKTMASGGSCATIVKDGIAIDIIIPGKPVIIITVAEHEPNPEMLRRFPLVNLTETSAQTEAVIKFIAERAMHNTKPRKDSILVKSLHYLVPNKVTVPYADLIGQYFTRCNNISFRTHISRIIDYVKFSAVIHQYQRDYDNEGYIIATQEDWEHAKSSITLVTSSSKGHNLTYKQKAVVEVLKVHNGITVNDITNFGVPYDKRGLYRCLNNLINSGVITSNVTKDSITGRETTAYSLVTESGIMIPSYSEMESACRDYLTLSGISVVIDNVKTGSDIFGITSEKGQKTQNECHSGNTFKGYIKGYINEKKTTGTNDIGDRIDTQRERDNDDNKDNNFIHKKVVKIDEVIDVLRKSKQGLDYHTMKESFFAVDDVQLMSLLHKMINSGLIYEAKPGIYKVIL